MGRACLTAEFGMGSGLVTWQKPPGRRRRSHTTGRVEARRTSEASWLIGVRDDRRGDDAMCVTASPLAAPWWRASGEHGLMRSIKIERAISTGQLHALRRFHIRPINVVVFHGSSGKPRFEVGFPLRCLQRLSRPFIATLHCGWRHNSSTRGTFVPVLSY